MDIWYGCGSPRALRAVAMIAIIGLELIGDDYKHRAMSGQWCDGISKSMVRAERERMRYEGRPKAWVARLVGLNKQYVFEREFLSGKKDYAEANSNGSRGVYRWYDLEEGDIYEISDPQSWTHADRYFALSMRGKLIRMELDEVIEWFLLRVM